jgi:hypothetical protein
MLSKIIMGDKMKSYSTLLLAALLFTSCGSDSGSNAGPGAGQFQVNKNPKAGQQTQKIYENENREIQVYLDDTYTNSAKCTYDKYTSTKTLVKVDGDDIFVHSFGVYSELIAGESSCPATYSFPATLKKKSIAGEIKFLEKEVNNFVTEECLEQCSSSRLGNVIKYSGVYASNSISKFKIDATLVINTESPWLTAIESHSGTYSTLDGSRSEKFSNSITKAFLNDIDSLNVNFDDYSVQIYESKAQDITVAAMSVLTKNTFGQQYNNDYTVSFSSVSGMNSISYAGLYHYGEGVKCYTVNTKEITSITEFDDYIYENRLSEKVLTITTSGDVTTLDLDRTQAQFHEACQKIVDENNTGDNYTGKYGFMINKDGSITMDLYSRDSEGSLYVAL